MNIYWALDPFAAKDILRKGGALIRWIQSSRDTVRILYAATPMETKLVTAYEITDRERYSSYPTSLIKKILKNRRINSDKIVVLNLQTLSLTSVVKSIGEYLLRKKADLVICSTHSRTGFERFMLGSFAETLVHIGKIDILTYGPHARIQSSSPEAILYAHDFSKKGDAGLRKVLLYAKTWKTKLIIFHQPFPAYSIEFEGQDQKVVRERKRVLRKSQSINALLKKERVPGSVHIIQTWLPISESILRISKQNKIDLVALTSQSGKFITAIGGSVTRQTLRRAPIPVLVLKV